MSALPTDPANPSPLQLTRPAESPPGPLSEKQMQQIIDSGDRARPIRKAARFASGNGWLTLLAGFSTVPFAIGNLPLLTFAVLLGAIGTRELTLRRRLLRFVPRTTRKLAINQLMLGALLIGYAVWMTIQSATSEGMIASTLKNEPMLQSTPELSGQLDGLAQLERIATAGLYLLMILVAVLVQGGSAIYYQIRGRALARFCARTPEWIIDIHHAVEGSR
ncbi:MAG: hypothetical protein KC996_01670 [Phycisphaerales bacterium]|nr:hypothetical protein [Phycisphaerales bacterium]